MNKEFWAKVENAYLEAAELPGEQRTPFLEKVYRDRPDVRLEVESLLQHKEAAEHLTQSSIVVSAASLFDDDDDLIGTIVGGKYRVRECIGSGGQADVYLADHIALDSSFALKRAAPILRKDPEFRQRFLEEARRAVVLRHDNVARVHDVLESGGEMFVVMEHIEGETLRQRLERIRRPLTVEEFLPIALQCAAALAAAHEKRIVHLDVKPENIMLTTDGRVKICDFGIARRLSAKSNSDTSDASTPDWTFAGTPAYMAPEVILSYQFDERADLFSLGTVFYEMLTGRNPFLAATSPATTARVVSEPAALIDNPAVNRKLEKIVMRLLEKDPEDRFHNARELQTELDSVRRSQRRLRDAATDIREAFTESRWIKIAAFTLLAIVAAASALWMNWYRIERVWLARLPERRIVVVLPFTVIQDSAPRSYMDGLTELITAKLAELSNAVPQLIIRPASEVRQAGIISPQEASGRLGANLALEGSVYAVGDSFQFVLRLTDPKELKQLRSKVITVSKLDSLVVENGIMTSALQMLELEIMPAQRAALAAKGTSDPQAYEFYLNAIGYLASRTTDSVENAIQQFREALILDNSFTLPRAGLGEAYLVKYEAIAKDPELITRAQEACERALSIDPDLQEGHICSGNVYYAIGEYRAAVEEFRRALQSKAPSSLNVHYESSMLSAFQPKLRIEPGFDAAYRGLGRAYQALDDLEAAEATYLKAVKERPDYLYSYTWLGQFYATARQKYGESVELFKKARDLSPDNLVPHLALCGAYILLGRHKESIEECTASIAISPTASGYMNLGVALSMTRNFQEAASAFTHARELNPKYYKVVGHLARAYYWIPGKRGESLAIFRNAISLAQDELRTNPYNWDVHIMTARYWAMVGDRNSALSHLNTALKGHPKNAHYQAIAAVIFNQFGERALAVNLLQQAVAGGYSTADIDAEVELDNLREDPGFRAFIAARATNVR